MTCRADEISPGMSQNSWPNAVPFDPDAEGAVRFWDDFIAAEGRPPRRLLLVSGEAARYSGWSARSAIALADALAARGPVVLADLHFEQPELDGLVAAPDAEGIADAVLFGASLDRIALTSPDHAFDLVPAGGPVPDVAALFRDSAWGRVAEEAARRGATLVLYAPWRARGLESLRAHVDAVIMLGGHTDARLASGSIGAALPVSAVLAPSSPRAVGALEPEPAPTLVSADGKRAPTHRFSIWQSGWRGAALRMLLIAAVIVGAAAILRGRESAPVAEPPPGPPPPPASGTPTGLPMPFAVAIEAHQEQITAAMRVMALRTAEPTTGFFLAPVLVDSVIYYRVMAGPVRDSASAAGLMAALIRNGHKTGGSDWDIRNAPLAFELGVFDARPSAEAKADSLAQAHEIPAYVLAVPYSGGGEKYHVYCGAYAGPAEADVMRQVLADAGVSATLVQRIGRSTS